MDTPRIDIHYTIHSPPAHISAAAGILKAGDHAAARQKVYVLRLSRRRRRRRRLPVYSSTSSGTGTCSGFACLKTRLGFLILFSDMVVSCPTALT